MFAGLLAAVDPVPQQHDRLLVSRARVGYKAPDEIIVLDEIPINAAGKVSDRQRPVMVLRRAVHMRSIS